MISFFLGEKFVFDFIFFLFCARKWKGTVDDWVRLNPPEQHESANLIGNVIHTNQLSLYFVFFVSPKHTMIDDEDTDELVLLW